MKLLIGMDVIIERATTLIEYLFTAGMEYSAQTRARGSPVELPFV